VLYVLFKMKIAIYLLYLHLDTFELSTKENQNVKLNWTHEELIWSVDRSKFRNPKCSYGDCHNVTELCKAFEVKI
jgi:hypothetical protein